MLFEQLFDKETSTYTYLLADEESREAVLIDTVREQVDRDMARLDEYGLQLVFVVDTHVHADHVTGAALLRERTGARSAAAKAGQVREADVQLEHGDSIPFGRFALSVIATPGHTNSCLSFYEPTSKKVFTGDALLIGGCGRTDFQQGDPAKLFHSIRENLFSLDDDVVVYPGHDYRGKTSSTVGTEKADNPRIGIAKSKAEFVDIMNGLGLPPPKHIHEAVPANQHGGAFNVEIEGRSMRDDGIFEVTPAWLAASRKSRLLIDVRGQAEYVGELGHIDGAVLAPLDELGTHATSWNKGDSVVVICRAGRRSVAGAKHLMDLGFHDVASMVGGMIRWNDEGRPTTRTN